MKLSIIYILNTNEYKNSLDSLLNNLDEKNEIIIMNTINSQTIENYLIKHNSKQITIINAVEKSLKECICEGVKKAQNKFIHITCSSILYPNKTISKIINFIENSNNNIFYISNTQHKNIENLESELLNTSIYSYILNKETLDFLDNIVDMCDSETNIQILLHLLKEYPNISYIENIHINKFNNLWIQQDCYFKDWYTKTIEEIYIPFLKNNTINILQQNLIYLSIYNKFQINKNSANKEILLGHEIDDFFESVGKLLNLFDETFFDNINNTLSKKYKHNYAYIYMMLSLKEKIKNYSIDFDETGLFSINNNNKIYIRSNTVNIDAMNYYNNLLTIDAHFEYIQLYDYKNDSIYALVNGKRVEVEKNAIYSLTKYFSKSISKKYTFQLKVPIQNKNIDIQFILNLNSKTQTFPLKFERTGSRLSNIYPNSYWTYKGITVKYKNKTLIVKQNNFINSISNELLFYKDLLKYSKKSFKFKTIFLRTLYWIGKPFYSHKRIWIYFDKLYKAGDNGECAISYSCMQNDNISHYYVLNKDSYDFDRIKQQNIPLLKFNTIRHKLMCLYAENIVATHPDIIRFCGYGKNLELAFRNLFNANIICIAHGLTMQKNADVQNRLYDNTMFYTTSSKYEVEHLLKDIYGYNKEQIALTGMARFDKMFANDQRKILITPTWRKSVSGTSTFNSPKKYNNQFKNSTYYKIYNSLINDKELIECAKKYNYKIIFLLHPAMSSQINDYDKNDFVTFIQATSDVSYHDILCSSSLMVTDYSGVQYDFAYIHKPIIYYHHKLLPPRFEEGALKYDTMGFGNICTEHTEIVKELIKYMENDCKIEKKYEDRINSFFAFNDQNNSQRIYEEILKYSNNRRK